ncbi:MAG: PEP/pyruvate-binding domain-containing protein [Acidimicrobiales bacterium]|nr:PEP/pyruvate-binding domain-containing protein [Acidimicrobiales bacterium]
MSDARISLDAAAVRTDAEPCVAVGEAFVVGLHDDVAVESAVVGAKAAALARAHRAGIATLPGVVLTTAFADAIDHGGSIAAHGAVPEAFERAGGADHPLVVRSSSTLEDTPESSMAGQFDSVIGINGLADFAASVQVVLDSRTRAGVGGPIAVLVQPLIEPALGGVLFGVDPVSGRSDRRVVSAVRGGPEPLVSGAINGSRYVVDPDGRVVDHDRNDGPDLSKVHLLQLVRLAERVAEEFGRPQDVEWAIAEDGQLWLLQSRPVTSEVRGIPQGRVYGPGPVAETFPEPLTELEDDLWVPPLREAVRVAVLLAGTATRRDVEASEVVVVLRGHVGIDLHLTGDLAPRRTLRSRMNPLPGLHRLRGAWRVGRLRAALPALAEHLLDRTDADLRAVPAMAELTDRQIIALLHRSRGVLRALHAHEILMGMLTDTGENKMTGSSVALRVLVEGRQDGLTDAEILERSPVVLALTPPRVAPRALLPADATAVSISPGHHEGTDNGILREALRLRVRWVQELTGRAAWELGTRLSAAGQLTDPELVRHLTLGHLEAIATKRAVVVPSLVQPHHHDFGAALPAWFQVSDTNHPIRVQCDSEVGGGTGAGGGIGRGRVTYDATNPPAGSVLVTTTLTPGLGPLLSELRGIVAETGSVLSHLAILAREAGVATVVGYAQAVDDLPEGTMVVVDGDTGRVTVDDGEPAA